MAVKEIALWPYDEGNCQGEPAAAAKGMCTSGYALIPTGAGPTRTYCLTDLLRLPKDEKNVFGHLDNGDVVSIVGHCAPGLCFMASPNKLERAFPRFIAVLLKAYGFRFRNDVLLRGCNSATEGTKETPKNLPKPPDAIFRKMSFALQLKFALDATAERAKMRGFKAKVKGYTCKAYENNWPPPDDSIFVTV